MQTTAGALVGSNLIPDFKQIYERQMNSVVRCRSSRTASLFGGL